MFTDRNVICWIVEHMPAMNSKFPLKGEGGKKFKISGHKRIHSDHANAKFHFVKKNILS